MGRRAAERFFEGDGPTSEKHYTLFMSSLLPPARIVSRIDVLRHVDYRRFLESYGGRRRRRQFRHFPDASSANLTRYRRAILSPALINLDRDGATVAVCPTLTT